MEFLNSLKSFSAINTGELRLIQTAFEVKKIKKGGLLACKNEICSTAYWTISGIVKEYDEDEITGREDNYWILGPGNWIYQIESFINKTPSTTNIGALTDVECYCLKRRSYENIITNCPDFAQIFLTLQERSLIRLEKRNRLLRIKNAKSRYEQWEKDNLSILNQINLKEIASFLNISQQQLSRIRRKRAGR